MLAAPLERLFAVREVAVDPPRPARVHASVECNDCGEPTMETRVRQLPGQQLCLPCFERGLAGKDDGAVDHRADPVTP